MQDNIEDRLLLKRIWDASRTKKRDISLEQDILAKGDPDAACLYAIHVVRGAWEQAEGIIAKASIADPTRRWRGGSTHQCYLSRFPDKDGVVLSSPGHPSSSDCTYETADTPTSNGNYSKKYVRLSYSSILISYLRLTKKRLVDAEKFPSNLSSWHLRRFVKSALSYAKLAYEHTGEVVDFGHPRVSVVIIEEIKNKSFSKKPITKEKESEIIKDLETRMALYSFTNTDKDNSIKDYFESRVEAMNKLMEILSEHDENMTIGELKKVLRNEKAA